MGSAEAIGRPMASIARTIREIGGLKRHHLAPVSGVVPCFRCTDTIEQAVNSVAAQTLRPAEVILVDDGEKYFASKFYLLAVVLPWLLSCLEPAQHSSREKASS